MSLVNILTQTGTNVSEIYFTSGLDSTYDIYLFKFFECNPATQSTSFSFQGNATGQTGFNEVIQSTGGSAYHEEGGADTTELRYTTWTHKANLTTFQRMTTSIDNGSENSASGELWLHNVIGTNHKQFRYSSVFMSTSNYCENAWGCGYFNTQGNITEIRFKMDSGNFDGQVTLYGVAKE